MSAEHAGVFEAVRALGALVGPEVGESASAAKLASKLGGEAYERALRALLNALAASATRVVDAAVATAVGELPSDSLERMIVVFRTTPEGRRFGRAVDAVCDEVRRVTGRPRRRVAPRAIEIAEEAS